jgi:hypothetical protein
MKGAIMLKEIEAEAAIENCRVLINQIDAGLSAEGPFEDVSSRVDLLLNLELHLEHAASALERSLSRGVDRFPEMKPRTVYEKAVQDFTETARQLARLNQHFRQASFAEFEMLMGLDDEALKRYGLPKPMVERALIEVYQTVMLDQQR